MWLWPHALLLASWAFYSSSQETDPDFNHCAVCIEGYQLNDVVRILPCKWVSPACHLAVASITRCHEWTSLRNTSALGRTLPHSTDSEGPTAQISLWQLLLGVLSVMVISLSGIFHCGCSLAVLSTVCHTASCFISRDVHALHPALCSPTPKARVALEAALRLTLVALNEIFVMNNIILNILIRTCFNTCGCWMGLGHQWPQGGSSVFFTMPLPDFS